MDDVRQRWMAEIGEQTCFAFEGAARFVGCSPHLFDSHDAAEPLIHGFINGTHPALSQLADNAIAILENCVWRKHRLRSTSRPLRRKGIWSWNGSVLTTRDDPELDAAPLAISTIDQTNSGQREMILPDQQSLRLL